MILTMKKLMLALSFLFVLSMTTEAQIRPPHPRYRHPHRRTVARPEPRNVPCVYTPRGEFRVHVIGDLGMWDWGAIFRHEIPYHFSVGGMAEYQLGNATSIGLGAEYYSSYGQHCRLFENMQETYIHTVPIYASLKFAVPYVPVSPFIEGRLGFSIPAGHVTCYDYDGEHRYISTGLYTAGGVGLKIYRVYLSCGVSVIDVVDSALGFNGGRKDVITDFYTRLSFAF